jgi:hypothetical protein
MKLRAAAARPSPTHGAQVVAARSRKKIVIQPESAAFCTLTGQGWAFVRVNPFRRAGRAELTEQKIAPFLAIAARFRADAAVVVRIAVLLALVGALLARDHARMELGMHELMRRFCLPHEHAPGGFADVGAIQIRCDAAPQMCEIVGFGETRIGATAANLRARGKRLERFGVVDDPLRIRVRMTPKHHFNGFHEENLPHKLGRRHGMRCASRCRWSSDAI